MELKLFGTDEFKEEFVIFYIDMGEELNAYIWVEDGRVKITDIYGLASYCNHAVSPFYVGRDMPEEFIEEAYKVLTETSEEDREKMLDKFNNRIDQLKEDEEDYREREEYEDDVIENVEKARDSEDGMFWLM